MPEVFRLAYIDLATALPDEAEHYYKDVIGTRVTEKTRDTTYFSLGLDHHNLSLRTDSASGLDAIGLQTDPGVSLAELARRLQGSGLTASLRTDSRPGIGALLEVPDVCGQTFHLFSEIDQPAPGFARSGIVPLRLGHVALLSDKADELLRFLTEILGFWKTDWFEDRVTFLTCNRDHHVFNVAQAPVAGVHHVAFELRGIEHQVLAMDRLAAEKRPTRWGPSRHTAGHNIAAYHHGADDLLVELYAEMDVFIPQFGSFEPKPWHEDVPQRPRRWRFDQVSAWETGYEFDLLTVAWGVKQPADAQ